MENKFKKGEIVWAKVRGFPWWPGRVKNILIKHKQSLREDSENCDEYIYSIDFFGDSTHVDLPSDKVVNFKENFSEYSKTRQKRLLKSIETAKKLIQSQKISSSSTSDELYLKNSNINKASNNSENNISNKFLGRKTHNCSSPSKFRDININININLTNSNHNTINIAPFSDFSKANKISTAFNGNKEQNSLNLRKKKEDDVKIQKEVQKGYKDNEDEDNEDSEEEEEEDEETPEEKLKKSINSFLRYRIEKTSSNSTKFLLASIDEIENNLKDITSSTFVLTKDIISVLMSLTMNNNQEIFIRSSQLLAVITQKIVKELFDMTTEDLHNLPEEQNKHMLLNSKTIDKEIMNACNNKGNSNRKKRNKDRNLQDPSLNKAIYEKELKQLCENDKDINVMINILQSGSYEKAITIFNHLSNDFFKNKYKKKNPELDQHSALLRKYVCIKMKKMILQIVPTWDIEGIQQMIIYFEYKQREKDMSFGKKYLQHIKGLHSTLESLRKTNEKDNLSNIKDDCKIINQ